MGRYDAAVGSWLGDRFRIQKRRSDIEAIPATEAVPATATTNVDGKDAANSSYDAL